MNRRPPSAPLGQVLQRASSGLATLGNRVLAPTGVTSSQWKVLALLTTAGEARVNQLVEALDSDQAAVSRLVARMEHAGLLRRRADRRDARATALTLTARGRKASHACDRRLRRVMRALLEGLRPGERRTLVALLTRLNLAVAAALARTER
jgi:MarR family transcriptional regulator, organic hydroperoxide resistance regulator